MSSAEKILNSALASLTAGRKETARKLLSGMVAKDPSNKTAWLYLAVTLPNEKAAEALKRVLVLDPACTQATNALYKLTANPANILELADVQPTLLAVEPDLPVVKPALPASTAQPAAEKAVPKSTRSRRPRGSSTKTSKQAVTVQPQLELPPAEPTETLPLEPAILANITNVIKNPAEIKPPASEKSEAAATIPVAKESPTVEPATPAESKPVATKPPVVEPVVAVEKAPEAKKPDIAEVVAPVKPAPAETKPPVVEAVAAVEKTSDEKKPLLAEPPVKPVPAEAKSPILEPANLVEKVPEAKKPLAAEPEIPAPAEIKPPAVEKKPEAKKPETKPPVIEPAIMVEKVPEEKEPSVAEPVTADKPAVAEVKLPVIEPATEKILEEKKSEPVPAEVKPPVIEPVAAVEAILAEVKSTVEPAPVPPVESTPPAPHPSVFNDIAFNTETAPASAFKLPQVSQYPSLSLLSQTAKPKTTISPMIAPAERNNGQGSADSSDVAPVVHDPYQSLADKVSHPYLKAPPRLKTRPVRRNYGPRRSYISLTGFGIILIVAALVVIIGYVLLMLIR